MRQVFLAAACVLAASGAAFAHAHLESASPPVGGTTPPPQELRLTFSESLESRFSQVTLAGPAGAIPVEKPTLAPGDNRTLVVRIGKPLAPGQYKVDWRAVSTDTHKTQGAFGFTVK